ncbi:MAG: ATP-binding cassette domain-containing protein [Magnetococcales bacterium]|nr:ATP-binding cassette domain-containing protein [Magnetococcales bacterium]
MGELLKRMMTTPWETGYLLLASLLIHVLGFASSLYVMQVLNRYVTHGVGVTLATLTIGVLLALLGEFIFRLLRMRIALLATDENSQRLGKGLFGLLLTVPSGELSRKGVAERGEILQTLLQSQKLLAADRMVALSDVPFALLHLGLITYFSPSAGLVVVIFLAFTALLVWLGGRGNRGLHQNWQESNNQLTQLGRFVLDHPDTVRHFRLDTPIMARFQLLAGRASELAGKLACWRGDEQAVGNLLQGTMGVGVIAVGALQVVAGQLEVGGLMAVQILAVRALAPVVRLMRMTDDLRQADLHNQRLQTWSQWPVAKNSGVTLPGFQGTLLLTGIAYRMSKEQPPLFAGLQARIPAGSVVAITGRNGAGKSTLLRMIAGLLPTEVGMIQADETDLRLVDPQWWRGQVAYMPQEPVFWDATLWENLQATHPELSRQQAEEILVAVGMDEVLRQRGETLDTRLEEGGRTLPVGIRKRLALARTLVLSAPLVLLDEPTEGVDRQTRERIYPLLVSLARQNRTLLIATHDEKILAGAGVVVNLDSYSGKQP